MKKLSRGIGAFGLALGLLASGCGANPLEAKNLTEGYRAKAEKAAPLNSEQKEILQNFAFTLYKKAMKKGENSMLSPLSVLEAMGMTANGMKGKAREEYEALTGADTADMNRLLLAYRETLKDLKDIKLEPANSIWFRDSGKIEADPEFLQTVADYYGADIFKAPFDKSTVDAINNWVSRKTDKMIEKILDRIEPDNVMYLINALVFDAKWEVLYEKKQVAPERFTDVSGQQKDHDFLYSKEHTYLRDGEAEGFLKPYKGGRFAFAAMLPPEGVTADDYASSLTGEKFRDILKSAAPLKVQAGIPKFESRYEQDLADCFKKLGLEAAFEAGKADFSGFGLFGKDLVIDKILHKTYISVDEKGTKAAAVTVVAPKATALRPDEEKVVILNRPFVYMILDLEEAQPLFIGTLNKLSDQSPPKGA